MLRRLNAGSRFGGSAASSSLHHISAKRDRVYFNETSQLHLGRHASKEDFTSNVWLDNDEFRFWSKIPGVTLKKGAQPLVANVPVRLELLNLSACGGVPSNIDRGSVTNPIALKTGKPYAAKAAKYLVEAAERMKWTSGVWLTQTEAIKRGYTIHGALPATLTWFRDRELFNADQFTDPAVVQKLIIYGGSGTIWNTPSVVETCSKLVEENGYKTGVFFNAFHMSRLGLTPKDDEQGLSLINDEDDVMAKVERYAVEGDVTTGADEFDADRDSNKFERFRLLYNADQMTNPAEALEKVGMFDATMKGGVQPTAEDQVARRLKKKK